MFPCKIHIEKWYDYGESFTDNKREKRVIVREHVGSADENDYICKNESCNECSQKYSKGSFVSAAVYKP